MNVIISAMHTPSVPVKAVVSAASTLTADFSSLALTKLQQAAPTREGATVVSYHHYVIRILRPHSSVLTEQDVELVRAH